MAYIFGVQRVVFISTFIFCIVLVPFSIFAQDPGVRDTVRIECDSLIVGQSRPVRLTICNDEHITHILLPFTIFTLDSGFAVYDSIRFVGRMADPSVLEARIPYLREINGESPDSIQISAFRLAANSLMPGNSVLAEIYFTGLKAGEMRMDSATNANGATIEFVAYDPGGSAVLVFPEFSTGNIKVVQGVSRPVISLISGNFRSVAGEVVSFKTSMFSPAGIPVIGTLTSLSKYDNRSVTPINAPTFTYNATAEVYEFEWLSTESEVGIWRATISACDSLGQCETRATIIAVLSDPSYLINLSAIESPGINFSSSMKPGNFDDDPFPEIASTGWVYNLTTPFSLYDNSAIGEFEEVFNYRGSGNPRKGLQIGFINSDANLDAVHFETSNVESIMSFLGDGNNGFPTIINSPLLPDDWGLVGALGNYNGDQYLDYAMGGRNRLKIYQGTANFMFQLERDFDVGDSIMSLVSKDFNNDGYDDFIVGYRDGVKVYLGVAAGAPTYLVSYEQTFGSLNIDVTNEGSDFNGDNYFDLCVATPSVGDTSSELMVYLGNGDGTFEQRIARKVLGQIVANTTGDFNGDGLVDIAFVNSSHHYLSVLFGDGDGNFTNELRFEVPKNEPSKLLSTDVDLDGDMDLVVNSSRYDFGSFLFVYLNESNPSGYSSVSVELSGEDNAQLELVSSSNKVINRVMNSMPSGNYYRRDLNQNAMLDDFAQLSLIEQGEYTLSVSPDPSQPAGTPFSVEFMVDGKLHRLAKEAVMTTDKYDFGINLSSGESVVPLPGNFIHINPPLFAWSNEAEMDFQLATDLDFYSIVIDTLVNAVTYQPLIALAVSDTTTYYWRIKPSGTGDFGPIYAFNLVAGNAACGDVDGVAPLNFLDLVFMSDNFFRGGPDFPDLAMADLDNDGRMSIVDMTVLIDYLFRSGAAPVCE